MRLIGPIRPIGPILQSSQIKVNQAKSGQIRPLFLNRRFSAICLALAVLAAVSPLTYASQETGLSQAAKDAGEAYVRALAAAGEAFSNRDFSKALDKLDFADQIQADVPDTWGMRGAIYAEQHAYEKAGDECHP